jgi:hypothetical protein
MAGEKSMVELIKVEWPHGIEIQVSYSILLKAWVISNSETSSFLPWEEFSQSEQNGGSQELTVFWKDYLHLCSNSELLKAILTRFTFCGKANF